MSLQVGELFIPPSLSLLQHHTRFSKLNFTTLFNPERELRGQRSKAKPPLNSQFTPHLREEEGYMFWHRGPASKYLEDTDLALFRL